MGTNYYLHQSFCSHCGKAENVLHIGKASAGWHFKLHVYPDKKIDSLDAWRVLFSDPHSVIKDEYDSIISVGEIIREITRRSWTGPLPTPEWYKQNQAEPGLNGCARAKIDGRFVIGHGEGTWDYCQGEEAGHW